MKTDKMFCVRSPYELLSASTLQRSEASKTLKRTFEHAHIKALSPPRSRLPADFSLLLPYLNVVVYAKEVIIFFNLPSMSSCKKNTAEEKNKTEYFSWSDDEVKLLLNVTGDYKTSKAFDFSHTCYKVRYLTPSMQLNLISWTTKKNYDLVVHLVGFMIEEDSGNEIT